MATPLPEGTVTLLFTDIEGSTAHLHRLGDEYATLLADQRAILSGLRDVERPRGRHRGRLLLRRLREGR